MKKTVASKTYARNNFSSLYDQAKKGEVIYVSDRGSYSVAIISVDKLALTSKKPSFDISKSDAFGMWKSKKDLIGKTSEKWLDEKRIKRLENLYETIPDRYKSNS